LKENRSKCEIEYKTRIVGNVSKPNWNWNRFATSGLSQLSCLVMKIWSLAIMSVT